MDKKCIMRKEMKQILCNLSHDEKSRQSAIIQHKLLNHAKYTNAKRISIYLNLKSEVDTSLILNQIFKDKKQCFIPRYKRGTTNMDMIELESFEEYKNLPETNWGIKQFSQDSTKQDAIETKGLDLILLPGLAFDLNGNRLGKGGGFYDAYLFKYFKKLKTQNLTKPYLIGLAFNQQIRLDIPMTDRDFKIDEVITV